MTRADWCVVAAGVLASVASCADPDRDVEVPEQKLPASFGEGISGPSVGSSSWKTYFEGDQLHALIAKALDANPDLHIALQRIEQARASVRHSTGALLPQVSAGASVGATKPGRYTAEGAGNASTEIAPGRAVPTPVPEFALGLEATWEIDAWGKLRNLREAAVNRYLATVAGAQLVKTGLVADVATNYFDLVALDHTRDVLERTLERQQEAVGVVRLQKDAGRANELAVQQFEAQLVNTKALESALVARVRESEGRINLLLGAYPRQIARDRSALERNVPQHLSTGVPADLLANRPDIREAELLLEAAKCDVEAARAAFFPNVQITAGVGLEAFNPRYLLSVPEAVFYAGTAGLVAPLINRSAIEAQFDAAKAHQIEAMYQYQKTVVTAFVEVANAVTTLASEARVVALKKEQKAFVEKTVETADVLYRAGQATYVEVLMAQQNALQTELELIEAMRNQHLASVTIYKALGGGWR